MDSTHEYFSDEKFRGPASQVKLAVALRTANGSPHPDNGSRTHCLVAFRDRETTSFITSFEE